MEKTVKEENEIKQLVYKTLVKKENYTAWLSSPLPLYNICK
jgi:hypothetical protein